MDTRKKGGGKPGRDSKQRVSSVWKQQGTDVIKLISRADALDKKARVFDFVKYIHSCLSIT
jgi:hypothetical protein